MPEFDPTDEQRRILAHPIGQHARVLAGPGTGKSRTGVVEEVLAPEPPRLRVRWDDGHSTVFAPTAGAAKIEPAKR